MSLIKKILLPLDLVESNQTLVPWVQAMAGKFEAELHLVYVIQDLGRYAQFYVPHANLDQLTEDMAEGAKKKLNDFMEQSLGGLPSVTTHVLIGNVAQEVVAQAKQLGVDLIIMGAHGRKGMEHAVFGSITERVIRDSKIPVLAVHPKEV